MGIALDERAVHEGTGVALGAIADKETFLARAVPAELPFFEGGKARAAPAAQAGVLYRFQGFIGSDFQGMEKTAIPVTGKIMIEFFGVNDAAVAENPAHLVAHDGMLRQFRNAVGFVVAHHAQRPLRTGIAAQGILMQ
ncbi:MAG: hypothetical protein BWY09_01411 [Candidatus Hydrogenedentes bacterium ADurb.Bin179]|nr:MAG: hypothetical protein BWY09_01411 [Candidatus Hydrogenedentes bacterium ADurb.Bin179]